MERSRGDGERGATSVEYAMLVSLIAAVIFVAVALLGQATVGLFDRANALFP